MASEWSPYIGLDYKVLNESFYSQIIVSYNTTNKKNKKEKPKLLG